MKDIFTTSPMLFIEKIISDFEVENSKLSYEQLESLTKTQMYAEARLLCEHNEGFLVDHGIIQSVYHQGKGKKRKAVGTKLTLRFKASRFNKGA